MSLCTDLSIVNDGLNEGHVATLKCKRWSCPECAVWCRRQVISKARDGNPTSFLTLTWNTNRSETPDEAAREMKRAWVLLRRRIKAKWPSERTPFIVVFERTQRGYPHMHILMRAKFIDQAWLSDQMKDIIDAPIVDIRAIKSRDHAFWYITKYLGKEPFAFEGCKRWWRSHDYECETEDPYVVFLFGDCLRVERLSLHDMLRQYSAPTIDIEMIGHTAFRWRRNSGNRWNPKIFGSSASRTSPGQSTLVDCGGIA